MTVVEQCCSKRPYMLSVQYLRIGNVFNVNIIIHCEIILLCKVLIILKKSSAKYYT